MGSDWIVPICTAITVGIGLLVRQYLKLYKEVKVLRRTESTEDTKAEYIKKEIEADFWQKQYNKWVDKTLVDLNAVHAELRQVKLEHIQCQQTQSKLEGRILELEKLLGKTG